MTETRVVDPDTGGAKGSKPARFDLIPIGPLWEVAELYGRGAEKYDERNWERGYKYSLSYAALQRHANLFWGGESYDSETGRHHLASVIFHAMALMEFETTHPEKDDRPRVTLAIKLPCRGCGTLTSRYENDWNDIPYPCCRSCQDLYA